MNPRRGSVQRFFRKHAEGYAKSASFARGSDLEALVQALKPDRTDTALDVATGTGFTAISLAKFAKSVVGIDITDEMLDQARLLANSHRLKNIKFEQGDAHELGYRDSSFDIVTTTLATHHFEDVPKFLLEAKRVLRPNGRLGIVDMSPPEGAETFSNEIEKLRDSSHVQAFTPNQWLSMLEQAGLHLVSEQVFEEHLPLESWLYPVKAGGREEQAVRLAWKSAPSQVKDLLKVKVKDGVVEGWAKRRIVLVAKNHVESN